MELKKYIEMGEKAAGGPLNLAAFLGQYDSNIRNMKKGKVGLPNALCIKLADLIGEPRLEVIAASELVTEKNEDRRKIFESCFSKAASITFVAIMSTTMMPSPAEATPMLDYTEEEKKTVYYVNSIYI